MKRTAIALLGLLVFISLAAQKKQYKTLVEALYAGRTLREDPGPSDLRWFADGESYSFTRRVNGERQIWIRDLRSGSEEMVFQASAHTFPATGDPFSFRSYQWTADGNHLLFQSDFDPVWRYSGHADYYLYSLADSTLAPIVEDAFTAEVSPSGKMVGYGKEGDLFTVDLATGNTSRLTNDGGEKFYNGRFGWANEEEFGLVQAWEWSPDSRYIAFWQTDEREVPVYKLTDFSGQHPEYMEIPYPKVGDQPPKEKLGIIHLEDGRREWLDIDPMGGYMPRIYWTARPHTLAVVWMNRLQDELKLYFFDVRTGEKQLVMEERSDTWIDVFDFFAGKLHLFHFPQELESFFWISDRDGYSHLYQYDYNGNLIGQVTGGTFDVIGIEAIDPGRKRLCYLSCEVSPLERHLYTIKFNGKGKKRLTTVPGTHLVNAAPTGRYFVDRHSSTTVPPSVVLRDRKGELVDTLAGHKRALSHLAAHEYAGRELFCFTTQDGQKIDGYLIKPMHFDPERSYPLILDVYGGPGSQGVYNSFETSGWHQWLAQIGYVVANINNRGNGGYGRGFEKVVHEQLGKWETHDFAEAARYLSGKSWIDGDRIGITGHSFGGFSAGMSLLNHPDVFKAAIVTAAISDHRNYDCILTERYMGSLEDNEAGYRESSMVAKAGSLEGEMLLVHSLLDDNVHPQNTFQLVKEMIDNGKQIDLKIYPAGAHGVAYDLNSRILLYKDYLDFLNSHLMPERQPPGK